VSLGLATSLCGSALLRQPLSLSRRCAHTASHMGVATAPASLAALVTLRQYGVKAAAFRTRACCRLGPVVPYRSDAELPRAAHRAKPLLASSCAARGVVVLSLVLFC